MELRQYLAVTLRWLWLIVLCAIIAGGIAYFFSSQKLPTYAAQSTVLLDTSRSTTSTPGYSELMVNERLAETYARLLTQREAIGEVKSQLDRKPQMVSVSVNPQRNTSIMQINVVSDDPVAAAYVANNLPDLINQQQRERQAGRYAATKTNLAEEIANAEEEVDATRALLVQLDPDDPQDQIELSTLSAKLTLQERTYESLRQNLFNVRLAEDQGTDILAVIEAAQVPTTPIGPNIFREMLMAALLGAAVGFGAAFFIEYLDDTIKAEDDLMATLGIGALALIGKIEHAGRRVLVSTTSDRAPEAEAYRMLRTNIRFSMIDEPLQSILVTSPGPSEGKSTTAANLAAVLAQAGHETILVDADLRRPMQHKIFEQPNRDGLTTALVERDHSVDQYLKESNTPGLRVLTSGPLPPNPSELLGSQRMREVMVQLQELAEYVVIDTSPVLAVADSSLLASFVSGALLVLRANATHVHNAQRALEQLEGVQAHVLGAVLNDVRIKRDGYYYYYYYASNAEKRGRRLSMGQRMRALFLSVLPRRG